MSAAPLGPPYGPPANLQTIFEAWRERGLPSVIDRAWFERIGLSGNLATRNLHALRFLRLIDDDRRPTEHAQRLAIAATGDFASALAAIVRTSYAKVWAICDPADAPRARIEDAFRHELPVAQRSRMVACFIGLGRLAGLRIAVDAPRAGRGRVTRRVSRVMPPPAAAVPPAQPAPAPAPAGGHRELFAALLEKFPAFDPAWPDGVKERWFDAFARFHDVLTEPAVREKPR